MPRLKPETQWFPLWSPLHVYVTPCSDQHYKRIEWVVYAEKASASELVEKAENRAKKRVNRAETLASQANEWERTGLKFESPTLTQI